MKRLVSTVLAVSLAGIAVVTAAPQTDTPRRTPEIEQVLTAFNAARPQDRELRVFQLDWAPSLAEAKKRAAKETRPIFFVSTLQLEDAGDLKGGHC